VRRGAGRLLRVPPSGPLGLRDGQVAFDLPAAQVDEAMLGRLYAQHEAELHAAPLAAELGPASPLAPVVMHCR